jgi:hypothetical protein
VHAVASDLRRWNVGQASRRGTFEERKAQAIARREEQHRIDREAYLLRQAERDALMDREDQARATARSEGRPIGVIRHGSRGRSSMVLMAAMLAATAGIGIIDVPSGRRYR